MSKRTHQLTEQASVDLASSILNDKVGWAKSKRLLLQTLYNYVETEFTDADDDIIEGAGLEADASYAAPAGCTYITAGAFVAAGIDPNINNATKLLDTALGSLASIVGGSSAVTTRIVKIQSPEQRSLFSNPINLISAPGANKMINILKVVGWLDYSGAAMNYGTDTLNIRYATGPTTICELQNTWLESGADAYEVAVPTDNTVPKVNSAIQAGTATQNDATGTSTSDIYLAITYCVLTWTVFEIVPAGGGGID
jgi:hypothetical protein